MEKLFRTPRNGMLVVYFPPGVFMLLRGRTRELDVSVERTEAVVLRGVDFSETSRIVTFLTPGRGLMGCMAAGARKPKGGQAGTLDTLNRLEIVYYWKDNRSVQRLTETQLLDGYAAVKRDLDKSVFQAFPVELVYRTAQENEPSREVYHALTAGLAGMAQWHGTAQTHAAWQVIRLLEAAGFAPDLADAIEPGTRGLGFSYDQGLVGPAEKADRRLSAEGCRTLRALAASRGVCPDVDAAEVFAALCAYAERQVGCTFRSLRVIEQIAGTIPAQERKPGPA